MTNIDTFSRIEGLKVDYFSWYKAIKINGKDISFKLDSGAQGYILLIAYKKA